MSDTVTRWQALAARLVSGGVSATPDGAPPHEYRRSPAAAVVAGLAAESGLFHFHFEQRAHLALPEDWVPPHDPTLAEPPVWENGVLPEAKYQSFRHDLPVASFHPHHRAKWATHELLHGLVGCAWAPDATAFFHATAARLAELLPVALWYFYDEAFLRRCPDHQGQGALFRTFCPACEAAAGPDPTLDDAPHWIADGRRFVDRELAAVARSRRLGRPVPHQWASIDLCSDGVAYALAHGSRLSSETFARFADRFLTHNTAPTLDALEARVAAVHAALVDGAPLPPLHESAAHGRARHTLQDLAWRIAQVAHETEGEAQDALDALLDRLADAHADGDTPGRLHAALADARQTWDAVAEDWEIPDASDVFALGYAPFLPATASLREGLESAMPLTVGLLGSGMDDVVRRFAQSDGLVRAALPTRFAAWAMNHLPAPQADLASWEAAVARVPNAAPMQLPGDGDGRQLRPGAEVVRFGHDVLDLAERVDAGGIEAVDGRLVVHDRKPLAPAPTALLLARADDGELIVLDLADDTADLLLAGRADDLDADEAEALAEHGVLVPAALHEHDRSEPQHR